MNREPIDPYEIQRVALDLPRVTLDDLAEALGETRASLHKYRQEDTRMPAVLKHQLAEFLRQHADTLRRLATELDSSA